MNATPLVLVHIDLTWDAFIQVKSFFSFLFFSKTSVLGSCLAFGCFLVSSLRSTPHSSTPQRTHPISINVVARVGFVSVHDANLVRGVEIEN